MNRSPEVAAIRVADEAFLVASTIERCPKTMMVRELIMNAIEAATQAPEGARRIKILPKTISGFSKLCIWNTGPGMSAQELHQMCDLAASIGKDKSLDKNFGMGAKVASLPSNQYGLRYRSCKAQKVSEVVLCKRDGVYGRLKRRVSEPESIEDVIDVTDVCTKEGYDLSESWTEVVLFGNEAQQDTVRDPYNGNPPVQKQWLADYIYHRFYRLPAGLVVQFLEGAHKLDGTRTFRTIPERAFPMGRAESVAVSDSLTIHYFYDPPRGNTSHNTSISGSLTTDVSICALVFRNEIYDVRSKQKWNADSPIFGITFGAKHISVHIELSDKFSVRADAYRQFLRYVDGEQNQVNAQDFAKLAQEHRPSWLIDVISSFAPAARESTHELRDELQRLLNLLRLKTQNPRLEASGELEVDRGAGGGVRIVREGEGAGEGRTPRLTSDDLLAVPKGAKRATLSLNAERAPEIFPLRDEAAIEEKGLSGKAGKFYPEAGQLFVNMRYPAVDEMRRLLEHEYSAASDSEAMRRMAADLAERTITMRVGRAVIFAVAKRLNREWTEEDMARAYSPESLSLAADDFFDAMQSVRRRMGQALRTGRQPFEEVAA